MLSMRAPSLRRRPIVSTGSRRVLSAKLLGTHCRLEEHFYLHGTALGTGTGSAGFAPTASSRHGWRRTTCASPGHTSL